MHYPDLPLTHIGSTPIAPAEPIRWDVYQIPEAKLLVDQRVTSRVRELASLAFTYAMDEQPPVASHVGAQGRIYREGDLAVKWFTDPSEIENHGGPTLQANICLSAGLRHIPPLTEMRPDGHHTFVYAGPRYFAALMPDDLRGKAHPVWLMSYEEGLPAAEADIPRGEKVRIKYFSQALKACGLSAKGVRFDDSDAHNTLSQGTFQDADTTRHQLVKLDITRAV